MSVQELQSEIAAWIDPLNPCSNSSKDLGAL